MYGKNERRLAEAVAYVHGRIEERIINFADQLSINPMELTARLGALLLGAGQWAGDPMSMRIPAREGSAGTSTVEGGQQPHGGRPQHSTGGTTKASKNPPRKVKNSGGWKQFKTKKARKAEVARRIAARKAA